MNRHVRRMKRTTLACVMLVLLKPVNVVGAERTLSAGVQLSYEALRQANEATADELAHELSRTLAEEQLSLVDVFLASNEIECLQLWLEGFCAWLIVNLTPLGIEITIDLTFDISHHNPDFVIASYPRVGGSPLIESDALYGAIQQEVSKTFLEILSGRAVPHRYDDEHSYGGRRADSARRTIAMYSEVDVIGHPGNVFSLSAGGVNTTIPDADALKNMMSRIANAAAEQTQQIIDTLQSDAVVTGSVGDVDQWKDKLTGGGELTQWKDETITPAELGMAQLIRIGVDTFDGLSDAIRMPEANTDQINKAISESIFALNDLGIDANKRFSNEADASQPVKPDAQVITHTLSLLDASSATGSDVFARMQSDASNMSPERFSEVYGNAFSQDEFGERLSMLSAEFEGLDFSADAMGVESITAAAGYSFCPKDTAPMTPHYLSGLNVLSWRYQLPELAMPQSYAFPKPNSPYFVGRFGHTDLKPADSTGQRADWTNSLTLPDWSTWGTVYPRSGWIAQSDEVKNRALAAFRAAHVVTRKEQLHFYNYAQPVKPVDGMRLIHPEALTPNDADTGAWQMISPVNTQSCSLLPNTPIERPLGVPRDPALSSATGTYVFNLWRRYQCCPETGKSGNKTFLGRIPARVKLI